MTFPASSTSRKFCLKPRRLLPLAFAAALIAGCSHVEEEAPPQNRSYGITNRFEWGVQHYESGDYVKAIETFESLRKEGSALPDYDLFSYYVGMSQFRLGHFPEAARELETFLHITRKKQERQDALLSLLLTYERLNRWKDATALAAETNKLTLFQNNRALLKLIWARALREQGELLGAKAALEEAMPFLDQVGASHEDTPLYSDPDQDLWGRAHFTSALIQAMECDRLQPKEIGSAAPAKQPAKNKGQKPRPPRRLYRPWLESRTDCLRKAVSTAGAEIFSREGGWSAATIAALNEGISGFGDRIQSYLREEAPALDRRRELEKMARENLYRLLATMEEQVKNFKNRGLATHSFDPLRKQVDALLVRLSHPS